MRFCQSCNAPLAEDAKYCGNCGRPVSAADGPGGADSPDDTHVLRSPDAEETQVVSGLDAEETRVTGGPDAEETRAAGGPDAEETRVVWRVEDEAPSGAERAETGDGEAPASVPPSRHPFADIRPGDYVRDVLALVLLIATFSMPWDSAGAAADRIHVVLVTLLTMASLTLPYLKRAGVLPESWSNAEVRVARTLANTPYFVVVALTIVVDIAAEGAGSGGVGVGVGFGLAGAVLAAQARAADQDGEPAQGYAWRMVASGLVAVVIALTAVRLVVILAGLGDPGPTPEWDTVALSLLEPLIFLAVLLVPAVGLLRAQATARNLLVALGLVAVVMGYWRMSEGGLGMPEVLSMRDGGPAELLWLPAAAAVSAAGVSSQLTPVSSYRLWMDTALRSLGLAGVLAGLSAVFWVVVVASVDFGRGTTITVLVLVLLALVTALVGRSSLRGDPGQGRPVALAAAAVLVLIAIIDLAVETAGPVGLFGVSALVVSALFVLAAVIVLALTVPRAVRDALGPLELGSATFGDRSRRSR